MPFAPRVTWPEPRRLPGTAALALLLTTVAYGNPPPPVELTETERSRVLAGKPVFRDTRETPPRAGIAFRVAADEACVWSVIGDLAAYARRVPSLNESSIYRDDENQTCVRFRASNWLAGTFLYHSCHQFPWPEESWGVFQLDPEKDNAFASASGFWRTETMPADDGTLVYYAAEVSPRGGLARLFRGQLVRRSLKTATQWLPEAVASGEMPACTETEVD